MRLIRVDVETGFEEGRQFGRGYSGAQKRDEFNAKQDPERPNQCNKSKIIMNYKQIKYLKIKKEKGMMIMKIDPKRKNIKYK